MRIQFDKADLRDLVREILAEATAAEVDLERSERLAYPEKEAAALLGIPSHALRDARLRGEVVGTRVGGRIGYERTELVRYLRSNRAD
ncbi:helix-turn-helix domain-containing protein [Botrimarina sp.]|uniref:helix-turn-helix domain-containing protein n=1 Tax=Botrimarina sp. TaxID=2795802 RepID=UPI0032EB7425